MARPREFDEGAVLDAAALCFWARGYEGTSVKDLVEHTGITAASLYNAFGDKRMLFSRALERYADRSMRSLIRRLESERSPGNAIREFFDALIERSLADPRRRGCLIVNSALEVSPHDAELRQVIAGYLGEIEAFFHRCVARGQADGAINAEIDARDTARHLLCMVLGIRVTARCIPERGVLEGMVRPALELFENKPPKTARAAARI